ncbi:MAG: hypothetical protein ACOX2F_01905 [bacterium]
MKKLFFLLIFVFLMFSCQIDQQLPYNAVVLEQVIFVDEVKEAVPQTILMPNGTTVTYKMPQKLQDGQLIKIRDIEGENPYYIKILLRERDEKSKK